ncbi:17189_t:CDS:2 [Entrophospora sp. SA101]|nr:17189_t:CDS:2 [Entrophospora sp. SA101]
MQTDLDQNVILNVGGTKFETKISTLLSQPDTLLGKMFHPRNRSLLKPTHRDNEYFFDRNPKAFYYILEYYRTEDNAGEIDEENQFVDNNETLTLEMMKKELDYFNIEMSMKELNLAEKAAAEIFTKFIKAIENLIYEAIRTFSSSITIEFFNNEYFFDRNPKAFYYILEYYRTEDNAGEIDEENQFVDNNETLTLEMMKKELDYFNIEMSMKELNLAEKAAAEIFTKFIKAIENLIYEAIRTFSSSITIEFFSSSKSPSIQFNDTPMKDKLLEYKFIGYGILDHFDESYLSDCLTRSFPFMDVYLETEIKYNSYNNSLFLYT